MQRRTILLFIFFLAFIGAINYVVVYNSYRIVSPISEKKIAAAVVTPTPTPSPSPTPTPTPIVTPTPTPSPTPTPTSAPVPVFAPVDLDSLFTKYSGEYSIDNELLKRIAKCESGFNPGASYGNGLYAGLFQFSEGLWNQTRNLLGWDPNPDLRFSAEEAIRTAAFMVSQGHLGIWPSCH